MYVRSNLIMNLCKLLLVLTKLNSTSVSHIDLPYSVVLFFNRNLHSLHHMVRTLSMVFSAHFMIM